VTDVEVRHRNWLGRTRSVRVDQVDELALVSVDHGYTRKDALVFVGGPADHHPVALLTDHWTRRDLKLLARALGLDIVDYGLLEDSEPLRRRYPKLRAPWRARHEGLYWTFWFVAAIAYFFVVVNVAAAL
jgi:hypothetical protein